jgi:actin-like protein 6A
VHDGYVLNNSVLQSPVGGKLLTEALRHNLASKGARLQPWYIYRSGVSSAAGDNSRTGAVTASATAWATDFVTADIKESICRVNEVPFVEEENLNMPVQSYELPDGSNVDIGVERFKIPEILFNSVRLFYTCSSLYLCWKLQGDQFLLYAERVALLVLCMQP